MGGDLAWVLRGLWLSRVSIHAPAWGATPSWLSSRPGWPCFNPRPRMGGDPPSQRCNSTMTMFQSTPPHGGRRHPTTESWSASSFNPRPRMGGDRSSVMLWPMWTKFQSTPPHGGRHSFSAAICLALVSIHAPAWGATLLDFSKFAAAMVSIHAPAWGATAC